MKLVSTKVVCSRYGPQPQYRVRQSKPEGEAGMINAKALTLAANKLREATDQARLAYQFCPGSYAMSAFQACLAAAEAFDRYVSELAFAHSAEWLRKFPKIASENQNVE